jgi:hypothetical protein
MKQKVRKVLAVSGMAIVIGTSGFGYEASANMRQIKKNHRIETRQENRSERHTIKKRIVPGIIQTVNSDSFTLKSGNKTYTIKTTESTRVLNRKWEKISLSDIKQGEKVRVLGLVSNLEITATTVRDISIPKITETENQNQ